jgi:hypothetical protein
VTPINDNTNSVAISSNKGNLGNLKNDLMELKEILENKDE